MPVNGGENPMLPKGRELDEKFHLGAEVRSRFPRGEIVAAAGHSLSRPCKQAFEDVKTAFERTNAELHAIHWGRDKKESDEHDYAFKLHLHVPACQTLSDMLGCDREDVNLGNGLSDDLIRLVETLVHPDVFGERRKMMCLKYDFNSDLTIVRTFLFKKIIDALLSAASLHKAGGLSEKGNAAYKTLSKVFLDPSVSEKEQYEYIEKEFLVVIEPAAGGLYDQDGIVSTIRANRASLAGALLPAVVFNTSQLQNIAKVNPEFVDQGIPAIWDFAHSIGNVQHSVKKDRVLAGAGCGYKHLNGTAGCPGVVFQNSTLLAELGKKWEHLVPTPISGWLSHGRTGAFDTFPKIDQFCIDIMQKRESIQRSRASNPEILALRVLIANLRVVSDFGLCQIMELKDALSECLFESLDEAFKDEIASGIFKFITPRAREQRGASICFSMADVDARKVEHALMQDEFKLGHRFEIDVRPGGDGPDTFRLTAHYAHMSFTDTVNLAYCLKQVYSRLASSMPPAAKRLRSE